MNEAVFPQIRSKLADHQALQAPGLGDEFFMSLAADQSDTQQVIVDVYTA